jgi:glycosyltransferase involved in cell wall biosynthesis
VRVALITPYLPSPANTGGRIRMYRLARALAQRGEVSLYACAGARETAAQQHRDELALYRHVRVRSTDFGAVPPLLSARRVRRSCPARLARDLARDHARQAFDALVVAHSYALATARALPTVPLVLDEHNIESRYQAEYFAAQARGGGPLDRREVALLAAWEKLAWQRASLVSCVSARDAEVIRAERREGVHLVPNGTALEELSYRPPSMRSGAEVLFVGLMSHAPNVAAARFLAREVMPLVWAAEPTARLVLCGRSPAREVSALADARIEVTGTVPSVAPYLARAAVYANALFQGAGSSLKVPEAMASGVPLVSTAVGVRGFPMAPDEHFLPAESASEFARAIVTVLRERARFDAAAARAREVAEAFDWQAIGNQFATLVERAAEGSRV